MCCDGEEIVVSFCVSLLETVVTVVWLVMHNGITHTKGRTSSDGRQRENRRVPR